MTGPFVLGWEEWASLPDLGLPAIKVKVDTGARTSALHATGIRVEGSSQAPMLRFRVHPVRRRVEPELECLAALVGERMVTSSNGEGELRYVIATRIRIGDRSWPIEITLTNRETMSYRMLLGRSALEPGMLVDPCKGLLQPRLSYRAYRGSVASPAPPKATAARPLTLAILTQRPASASNILLAERAVARGHRVELIERRSVSLFIEAGASAVLMTAGSLPKIDAVIARSAGRMQAPSLAILRQLELLGAVSLNPADALALLGEPIRRAQRLAGAGVAASALAVSFAEPGRKGGDDRLVAAGGEPARSGRAGGKRLRLLVIDGVARAALVRPYDSLEDDMQTAWQAAAVLEQGAAAAAAVASARALGLGLAAVDIDLGPAGPLVADISPAPALALYARLTGLDAAGAVIDAIERAAAVR